jgi:hypothetical protein
VYFFSLLSILPRRRTLTLHIISNNCTAMHEAINPFTMITLEFMSNHYFHFPKYYLSSKPFRSQVFLKIWNFFIGAPGHTNFFLQKSYQTNLSAETIDTQESRTATLAVLSWMENSTWQSKLRTCLYTFQTGYP